MALNIATSNANLAKLSRLCGWRLLWAYFFRQIARAEEEVRIEPTHER